MVQTALELGLWARAEALCRLALEDKKDLELILQEDCERHHFPKSEFRLRQILCLPKLIPEFKQLLDKGIHLLDYLFLLSRLSTQDQKIYAEWVKHYQLNANTQAKCFEWLTDLADRDFSGNILKALAGLGEFSDRAQMEKTLFEKRFPVYVSQLRSPIE